MTINTISIESVQKLRDKYTAGKDGLSQRHGWDNQLDVRASIFGKYINLVNALQISHWYFNNCLTVSAWYDSISLEKMDESNKIIYLREYDSFTKISTVQIMMLGLDSAFRQFVRALDPSACMGGTAEFQGVYQWLFKRLNIDKKWVEHVELIRMVRNTVHNNGVYYHRDGKNKEVQYQGNVYKFEIGKHVSFVTWQLLILWLENNVEFITEIVESVDLKSIQVIDDQYIKSVSSK